MNDSQNGNPEIRTNTLRDHYTMPRSICSIAILLRVIFYCIKAKNQEYFSPSKKNSNSPSQPADPKHQPICQDIDSTLSSPTELRSTYPSRLHWVRQVLHPPPCINHGPGLQLAELYINITKPLGWTMCFLLMTSGLVLIWLDLMNTWQISMCEYRAKVGAA